VRLRPVAVVLRVQVDEARRRDHVVVEEQHDVPPRRLDARVLRRCAPSVRLADPAHPVVPGQQGGRVVGRAVVHHDDLVGRRILRGERFQAARQDGSAVVGRHDDAQHGANRTG
jgi:hypothetical protein